MDTMSAFARGESNRGREPMVFDWHKAARLIKERKPDCVSAGLQSDWGYTGGDIFRNGKPVEDDYTYLASTWACPEIDLDGEVIECYIMMSQVPIGEKWDADTKWPKSALDLLKS